MTITLRSPLDMHLHFRQDEMLSLVAPLSAEHFAGGVIMPNLIPPVHSLERLLAYTAEVKKAVEPHVFEPYMTLFFREYTREELVAAKPHIIGIKLYPAGATTNSDSGVAEISRVEHVFALMQELDIPLLVHGETHGFVMDREREFCDVYRHLATRFPALRITMEHITTADAVATLNEFSNLSATVTAHHLLITLDDVVGGLMNPHLFCKPIAKRPEDRQALLDAALSAHPKLMLGSDSAPHPLNRKESAGCAAGVFTAPILLPLLAELFDKHNALDKLQAFVSDNARAIYRIAPPSKSVTLVREPMQIPADYGNIANGGDGGDGDGDGDNIGNSLTSAQNVVIPMWAGRTITWRVAPVGP